MQLHYMCISFIDSRYHLKQYDQLNECKKLKKFTYSKS